MADIPWTWLGIRASGITAWGLLTAVVVWGILLKTQVLGRLAPPMKLLDLHRWLGVTAIAFLLVHLGLLIIDPAVTFTPLQILVPGLAPWQTTAVALGDPAGPAVQVGLVRHGLEDGDHVQDPRQLRQVLDDLVPLDRAVDESFDDQALTVDLGGEIDHLSAGHRSTRPGG